MRYRRTLSRVPTEILLTVAGIAFLAAAMVAGGFDAILRSVP